MSKGSCYGLLGKASIKKILVPDMSANGGGGGGATPSQQLKLVLFSYMRKRCRVFYNAKICIRKNFKLFNFFLSKSYVLDHFESFNMHIEKIRKNAFFLRCPHKAGYCCKERGVRILRTCLQLIGVFY